VTTCKKAVLGVVDWSDPRDSIFRQARIETLLRAVLFFGDSLSFVSAMLIKFLQWLSKPEFDSGSYRTVRDKLTVLAAERGISTLSASPT
jgi:hypothetical protein